MLVRQVQAPEVSIKLAEGTTIDNTANIDRGFWDIDYAFLGTAGGRADGPQGNQIIMNLIMKVWKKAPEIFIYLTMKVNTIIMIRIKANGLEEFGIKEN